LPLAIGVAFAVAAVASVLLGFPLRLVSQRLRILDKPGERSSHTIPTPRTGGIAIVLGLLAGVASALWLQPGRAMNLPFLVAAGIGTLVAAVSFLDDVISIPSLPRLAVHFLVAGGTIAAVKLFLVDLGLPFVHIHLPWWAGLILGTFFVVAYINFFNFMDGINGIAAFQGILGGATLAILLAWNATLHSRVTESNSTLTAAALAGACIGFLPHNFPRARTFMGDVGSTTLGFALAMLTLVGGTRPHTGHLPWLAFVLPLGVFIYDATFTLIKRIIRRENFLKPHREHHYQLLIRSGWTHTSVTLLQGALMGVCCVGAIVYAFGARMDSTAGGAVQTAVLAVVLTMLGTYSVLVHRYFARHGQAAQPQPCVAAREGE
jgi:UDP-N-acetylmuramyl pentapeptide phosphotransferase/UDP-N-acetylglucosamine-1-phosphate transferase